MVTEYVYSPHYDLFIDKVTRSEGYDMATFHIHKKYEIYYQYQGIRRYYIDDTSYVIDPGCLVIIGADSVHKSGSYENSGHTRIVLNFSEKYLQPIAQAFPQVDLFSCFQRGIHVLPLLGKQQSGFEMLLNQLWYHYREDSPQAAMQRQLRMAELLLLISQTMDEMEQSDQQASRISHKTISKIQSHIASHYQEPLTLSGIAEAFYISPYYLSRLFKKTTGLSLIEYVNSLRLIHAKQLLEEGDRKIADIAEDSGFQTTAHFTRVFKAATELTPQQYKRFYQQRKP